MATGVEKCNSLENMTPKYYHEGLTMNIIREHLDQWSKVDSNRIAIQKYESEIKSIHCVVELLVAAEDNALENVTQS
jgi:hypothetical protein